MGADTGEKFNLHPLPRMLRAIDSCFDLMDSSFSQDTVQSPAFLFTFMSRIGTCDPGIAALAGLYTDSPVNWGHLHGSRDHRSSCGTIHRASQVAPGLISVLFRAQTSFFVRCHSVCTFFFFLSKIGLSFYIALGSVGQILALGGGSELR